MKFFNKNWHLLILVALSLTPSIWFLGKGDILINGVDTNFPLDPLVWFNRRFFVWDPIVNAGRDISSSTAGIFFHLIQVVPFVLGASLKTTQIISFIFWFSAIVTSSYVFARLIIPKNKVAQIVFVLLYSFNIYLFNSWENVKVANLSLTASFPLVLAVIISFQKGLISVRKFIVYTVLAGVLLTGAGINPAYFTTLIFGVLIYVITASFFTLNKNRLIYLWKSFFVMIAVLVLVNSFWILSTVKFLFFSANSISNISDIGFINWVDSLSANTSFVNILRLQGAWDWYEFDLTTNSPRYLPYAVNYFFRLPFVIFSFVMPMLVIVSFLFKKGSKYKNLYPFFGFLILVGVFLAAGTHAPTGNIYRLLSNKVPFFSFFRSPWYIFTPFITLSFASLVALLFGNLYAKFPRLLIHFAALVFVLGHFLYSYPLVQGKIFRPSRKDGFYVTFPDYVWETKEWLSLKEETFPRFVSYPDDDFENFDWGYRGIESIISLFSDQEIVNPSFVQSGSALPDMIKLFNSHIKRAEYDSALSMLPFFGADTIFYKRDVSTLAPDISSKMSLLTDERVIGEWSFFRSKNTSKLSKVYSPADVFINLSGNETLASVLKVLPENSLIISSGDTILEKVDDANGYRYILEADHKSKDLTDSIQEFYFNLPRNGEYRLILERYGLGHLADVSFIIDGREVPKSSVRQTDSLFILESLGLESGKHNVNVITSESENLVQISDFSSLNSDLSLRDSELPSDLSRTLTAFGDSENSQSINLPLVGFDPFANYVLTFDYKYFYGRVPVIEVLQSNERTPLKAFQEYVGSSEDWESVNSLIEPVETDSELTLLVTLPPNSKGGKSKSFFENIALKKTFDNQLFVVEDGEAQFIEPPDIRFSKINNTSYEIEVVDIKGPYFMVFSENYSPEWSVVSKEGVTGSTHFTSNGFTNGWYLSGASKQKLMISYKSQRVFTIGLIISGLVIALLPIAIFITRNEKE